MRPREPFNTWSHLVGLVLAVAGTWFLLRVAQGTTQAVAFGIYGATLVLLYAASAVYHGLPLGEVGLRRLRTLDHIAIYFLIAGTYTPVAMVTMRDAGGLPLLAAAWTFAAAGIPFKLLWLDAPVWVSNATYLAMGYLALVAVVPIERAVGAGGAGVAGGGGHRVHRGRRDLRAAAAGSIAGPVRLPRPLASAGAGGERVPLRLHRAARRVARTDGSAEHRVVRRSAVPLGC